MSDFSDKLKAGDFVVSSEIGPPKGVHLEHCLGEAEHMRDRVTAINVTDIQSAVMRVGSMAVCHMLKERGMEPILQMVCRDRNQLALQSDLLSAVALGIENVLCLTGDHNVMGDHKDSKPVFDLDSVGLLETVTTLMGGHDLAGGELEGDPPVLFPGAVVTPDAEPLEPQLIKMQKKIKAGARFFQTQAVYDSKKFHAFMNEADKFGAPVLLGIVVLKNAGMANYMNKFVAGVNVPAELIDELKADPDKTKSGETGCEIAARTIRECRDCCQGVHIMPLGWDDKVPHILDLAGL